VVDRIYLMNDDGTGVRAMPARVTNSHRSLAWLPDGNQLGFIAQPDNLDDFEPVHLDVLEIGSGAFRRLRTEAFVGGPQWSPDGSKIAYAEDLEPFPDAEGEGRLQVFVADADGSNPRQLGPRNVSRVGPTWSPDGTRLAFERFGAGVRDIAISTVDGSDEAPLPTPLPADFFVGGLTWSPDGARLAFEASVGEDFRPDIYVMNADGTGLTRLTVARSSRGNTNPVWSPDGTKLAFESDRDGNPEIYVMNADGSDQTRLTNDPAADISPAWRP
jgi:Tol biopolymer transport system component